MSPSFGNEGHVFRWIPHRCQVSGVRLVFGDPRWMCWIQWWKDWAGYALVSSHVASANRCDSIQWNVETNAPAICAMPLKEWANEDDLGSTLMEVNLALALFGGRCIVLVGMSIYMWCSFLLEILSRSMRSIVRILWNTDSCSSSLRRPAYRYCRNAYIYGMFIHWSVSAFDELDGENSRKEWPFLYCHAKCVKVIARK